MLYDGAPRHLPISGARKVLRLRWRYAFVSSFAPRINEYDTQYERYLNTLALLYECASAAAFSTKRPGKDGKQVSIPTTCKLDRFPALRLKEARDEARTFLEDPQKAKAAPAASGKWPRTSSPVTSRS